MAKEQGNARAELMSTTTPVEKTIRIYEDIDTICIFGDNPMLSECDTTDQAEVLRSLQRRKKDCGSIDFQSELRSQLKYDVDLRKSKSEDSNDSNINYYHHTIFAWTRGVYLSGYFVRCLNICICLNLNFLFKLGG